MKKAFLALVVPVFFWQAAGAQSFECGDTLADLRDGQRYPTVQIGTQCWLAKNLNYGIQVQDFNVSDNSLTEKVCYENKAENCGKYGGLYTWHEAMNYSDLPQGICPEGWHIPSREEWAQLDMYLGHDSTGQKMKAAPPVWDGNNSSNFNALPGGTGNGTSFQRGGGWAVFWSSTPSDSQRAWFAMLDNFWYPEPPLHIDLVQAGYYLKINGFSVRCVKD